MTFIVSQCDEYIIMYLTLLFDCESGGLLPQEAEDQSDYKLPLSHRPPFLKAAVNARCAVIG